MASKKEIEALRAEVERLQGVEDTLKAAVGRIVGLETGLNAIIGTTTPMDGITDWRAWMEVQRHMREHARTALES